MNGVVSGTAPGGDEPDLLAAEYVLGTLDLDERLAFLERLREDETMRATVASWERRLEAVAGPVGDAAPPAGAWAGIEGALFRPQAKIADFRVFDGGRAGVERVERARLEKSRDRWRWGTLFSGGLAAALAIVIGSQILFGPRPQPQQVAQTFVAAVNRGGDKPALIVRVDLKTQRVYVKPVAAEVPAGHSLELWYIDAGKAPKSMGLVQGGPQTLTMPQGGAPGGTTFAVSVEPEGGSKTGSPTGPVVYSGQLIAE